MAKFPKSQKGEKDMSIARINSVEFDTPEQMQERLEFLKDKEKEFTKRNQAECFIQIKTSETSILGILIYPNEESAEEGLSLRNDVMSSTKHKDSWYMDGEVTRFRINKTIY